MYWSPKVERQLDLSSVAARLRGGLVWFVRGSVDTPLTGVDTMLQTQGKIMQNWSSSVDTRSSSVDTRDSSQKTQSIGLYRDQVVSTQDQVVSTLETFPENFLANLGQCVDTRSSSVDTRGLPRTLFGLNWDCVSTLDHVVSTLEAFLEKTHRSSVTRKHISCSDLLTPLITL
ncbi:hypothetical protein Taro_047067 [Colocasia esculenta]|uniref:Uncharacterized protein n=1 Tax=Colocasia esculenta TaxID=4460 RepID=A0A843X0A6_COLES|nr:hypothetical protein [Colocasia esculenta]